MPLLDEQQQAAFLALLLRGASAVLACRELEVDHEQYLSALREDAEFRGRVEDVQTMLAGNVSAALYKSALEGKVTAQTFYLRHFARPVLEETPQDLSDLSLEEVMYMLHAKLPQTEEPEAVDGEESGVGDQGSGVRNQGSTSES